MVLLITSEELKLSGAVNQNLEDIYIEEAIKEAQDVHLRETIGDDLYNALQNHTPQTPPDIYDEIINDYVKYFLKYKTLSLVSFIVNFKIRNIGIAQQFSTDVNTTNMEDTKSVITYYNNKADFYNNRLSKFLEMNKSKIPEYRFSYSQITSPNDNHPVSSIYLGNTKKRFVGGSISSSGSSGGNSGSGEAVWGSIGGNILDQIDLQNALTIKVNRSELSRVAISGSFNDLTDKPTVPTKTSELTNDSGFLTEHQSLKTINNESLIGTGNITIEGFSGDYNDLLNKPDIPTKTSELTNDSNFITEIKTINNESLIGVGNIEIKGGGSERKTWYGNQNQFNAIPESELDQETDYYISGLIAWDDIEHPPIPTKTSDLSNDKEFTSVSEVKREIERSLKVFEKRVQYVSQAEYDAMEQAGSLRDGVTYFIEDNASNTLEMVVEFDDGTTTTYNVYIN